MFVDVSQAATIEKSELCAYPNPTNGSVVVNHPSIIKEVIVTDIYGNMILRKENKGSKQTKLDLTAFASGTYILNIVGQCKTIRIIKQ